MNTEDFARGENPSLRQEIRTLVEEASKDFRTSTSQKFLDSVTELLYRRLKPSEARSYLRDLFRKYSTFPDKKYIERDICAIESTRPKRYYEAPKTSGWTSTRAPGTPAKAEAVFHMISLGRQDTRRFEIAKLSLRPLTDDQIFEAYELWTKGQVHEFFKKIPIEE